MGVDLSCSIRSLLEGALERGQKLAAAGNAPQAAEAFDEAARLALQYADYASSPAEKKRRLQNAAAYRARAEQLRAAPRRAGTSAAGASAAGSAAVVAQRVTNEDAQQHAAAIEALILRSTTTWEQIAGLEETKRSIMSADALSLARAPDGVLLTPVRNMLFYPPPGCGNSLLAAATSNGLDATFFNVKVSSLLSKYFGESPKLVTALFDAARARAPSVVFLDAVDALAASRDGGTDTGAERRVLANLLSELDGVAEKGSRRFVLTIAATNTPWSLDAAVLSRLERKVYIPLPDAAARQQILEIQLIRRGYQLQLPVAELAERTAGFSGREMERLCKLLVERMIQEMNPDLHEVAARGRDAASAYHVRLRPIQRGDVEMVMQTLRPETTEASLARYQQ